MVRFVFCAPPDLADTPNYTAEFFVQSVDSFFNRGSPFELVNCKVEWIYAVIR
jgi:hypothetical protein